ncbi:hypothetical protein FQZ97_1079480 [compost metagenome]
MDTTVMANPMQFWIASAPPTASGGHALAASAENCGESATTEAPHAISSTRSAGAGSSRQPSAKIRPQAPDNARAPMATLALPRRWERTPPSKAPSAPTPITQNDNPETPSSGKLAANDVFATIRGTMVQKV